MRKMMFILLMAVTLACSACNPNGQTQADGKKGEKGSGKNTPAKNATLAPSEKRGTAHPPICISGVECFPLPHASGSGADSG